MFLVLTIRIGKSVLFYFTELNVFFIHIGLTASAMIGPFFFMYFRAIFHDIKWYRWSQLIHLLPAIALFIFSFSIGYREDRELWLSFIYIIRLIWAVYIVIVTVMIFKHRNTNVFLEQKLWILSVFFSVFFVWLAYTTNNLTSYIVGALTFSVLIYFLLLILFLKLNKSPKRSRRSETFTPIDDPVFKSLDLYLTTKEVVTNPDLTMPDVAKNVQLTPHQLSHFLNEKLNINFSKFINHYRIKFAIQLMKESPNLSLDSIAYDSGYNSLSTFYSAFRSITRMTPTQYKSMHLNS